ncbi:AarF/ABC1/UbiB kinase family protein [Clostridium sp. JN-9]|uniref:ABC1 kinase family protein n=1 Tax=Clostridium sp. JN-9 TaxID=2507159 RepID=UPI000FFE03A0|nr:AarF/ABC1/UbiB kinase family protein [Clostridium sp. JN-9]QAT38818.1 AarF/ABC1/UbiB kinase family protein [Clostridium sp. JN-9]
MYKNSVQRFREIVRVLAHYGFGFIVDSKLNNERKSPENLRRAFEELGPTFIKIGQILSTRPDILPAAYINELSNLQDNAPAEKFEDISHVFNTEFNFKIEDVFKSFNKVPLASASVAQVHMATLKDGRKVIVKIQRPDIKEKLEMDLSILYKILKFTKAKFTDALIDPIDAINEIMEITEKELDFSNEADNLIKFRKLNYNVAFVYSPYVIQELSGTKVITMENIDGFKITDMKKLKDGGYDLDDLGKKLALSYLKQVFEDGFFHGDPHPGNLLIRGGQICFIDFGIMGNLSSSLKSALNDAMVSVANKDPDLMISVIMSIGIKKGVVNRNKLYEDIDNLFSAYLNTSLKDIQLSVMLQQVFESAKRNNIRLPKDLTLLIRGFVIIEGVVASISPEIKILDIAVPYVKNENKKNIFKDLNIDELLLKTYNFGRNSLSLPSKIIEFINSMTSGRAKVNLEINNLSKSIGELNKMANRMIFALIIASMIIGSSLILNTNIGPKVYNISIIGITGYLIAAIMGFWLLISILKSGKL